MGTKSDYVYLPCMCGTRRCLSGFTWTSGLHYFSQSWMTIEDPGFVMTTLCMLGSAACGGSASLDFGGLPRPGKSQEA